VNGNATWTEAAAAFVDSLNERELSDATVRNDKWFMDDRRKALTLTPDSRLNSITADGLLPYRRKDETFSKATLATRYRHINVWLRWSVAEGFLEKTPMELLGALVAGARSFNASGPRRSTSFA
jgi:hypothetical protein